MFVKSNIMIRFISIICMSIFALTSFPLAADSFAGDRDRRGGRSTHISRQDDRRVIHSRHDRHRRGKKYVVSPRYRRHGHRISKLPRGYRRVWRKRVPYYYDHGVFYRPARSGFVVVREPVGAVVVSLPIGYQRVWVDDTMYYTYGGTFYRRVPSGYVIVDRPASVVVKDDAPVLVKPSVAASGQVIVDAPVLNVRSGPSLDDPRMYQIHEGYILEVHGKSNGWLYVQLPNGEFGWVKSVFTKPPEPGSG